jgi:hypothetical protein
VLAKEYHNMKKLSDLGVGQKGIISAIHDDELIFKLM